MSAKNQKHNRAKSDVLSIGMRIFGYIAAVGFFGFMFAPVMMSETTWIRVLFNLLLILIAGMLFFVEGSYKGERDCATTAVLDKRYKETGYQPDAMEKRMRYYAPKGFIGLAIGTAPWLLAAIFVAIFTTPYTYTLQDLPAWLSIYRLQPEIGNALTYYDVRHSVAIVEYVRIVSRFSILPFVYLFGTVNDAASLMIDRISPLLVLLLPLCNAVGYLFGPRRYTKTLKFIADAKAKPRKRLKKSAKERLNKAKEPKKNELV